MRTANIDADILKYLAGFACQKEIWTYKPTADWFAGKEAANKWFKETMNAPQKGIMQWMRDNWHPEEWEMELEVKDFWHAQQICNDKLLLCMEENDCEKVKLYFTPHSTFRHDLAVTQEYKGNRKDQPKPVLADDILEYLMEEFEYEIGDNIEADDLLGMNQTPDTVLCSNDKDLMMIPGEHFNFAQKEGDNSDPHVWQDLFGADRRFFVQLIAGDPTDNVRGIPGVGEKKAEAIVDMYDEDIDDLVEHIKDLYDMHYEGNSQQVMEEHAALVWILRRGETPETAGWRNLLQVVKD